MKKIIILLCSIFLLSGCYDYVEIEDLVIITGMIIDYEDNEYKITSQIIENENETTVKVFTTKGNSISECLSEISKLSNKDLFISHMKVLILTDNILKNDIEYTDYFLRNAKSKMNFYVYYVSDEYKDKVLNIYKENNGSALYIKDLMDFNSKIFSSSTPISFLDLMYKKLEFGIEPLYPNLVVKKNNDEDVLYLQDLVMFNNEKKKIVLNDKEGIFYNIITNNIEKTIINVPCDNELFSLTIDDLKTKYKLDNNKKININIDIKGKLNTYNCKYDINDTKTTSLLNNLADNYIKENINELITISKDNNIDFIGLGNYMYKHSKNKIDIKNIKTNTKVNTIINSIGEKRK